MANGPNDQKSLLWTYEPARSSTNTDQHERIWALRKGNHAYSCELLLHGQYGVEVQVFRDAAFLWGHRFETRALAVQFANDEQTRIAQGPA